MTEWNLAALPWLTSAPTDYKDCIQTIENENDLSVKGSLIRKLATHNLNVNQLTQLGKSIQRSLQLKQDLATLRTFRLAILSSSTAYIMGPALVGAAARHGIALDLFIPSYDQVVQEAIDPSSPLNTSKQDAVLLWLDYEALPLQVKVFGDKEQEKNAITESVSYIKNIRDGVRTYCGCPVIFQTLPKIPVSVFGSFDRIVDGTPTRIIEAFNNELSIIAAKEKDYLLDVAGLAERVGVDYWYNPQHWNMYKLPFDQSFVPLYVDFIARLLSSIVGYSRKCLVLDLDNTLWGGVIGDDGLEGINIGQGDPVGESFLAIQRMSLMLRDRGIILAVCSKNEEENARLPFRKHPEMLLKEEHISAFLANWQDKASNLEEIAKRLNIGIDSLVLLDDNPAERAQVRSALPMVGVPEVPSDPAYFPRSLISAGYFEAVTFSQEDTLRSEQYQANAKRTELQTQARDLSTYLKSLEMKITFSHFDKIGLPRIVQLINKSNQFNLTTRRYSEVEILELIKDPSIFTLQIRLTDRFGDNGMISVIICRKIDLFNWSIDTWLMSCRVLGRSVEQAVLNEIIKQAQKQGIKTLKGEFRPTGRNELVREHYKKLGFNLEEINEAYTLWSKSVENYKFIDIPMSIDYQYKLWQAA